MNGPEVWNSNPQSLPTLAAKTLLVNQTAVLTAQNALSVPSAGYYEVLYYMSIPSGLTATGAITLTISWTDSQGTQSQTSLSVSVIGKSFLQGVILIECVAGSSIMFNTTFLTVIGTVNYNLAVLVKRFQ